MDAAGISPNDVTTPACPVCGAGLVLGSSGELDHWTCPAGHGVAITLSEAYGEIQDDEIHQLWQKARSGSPGDLPSPFGGPHMVRVVVDADPDEVDEGQAGDGDTTVSVTLDVDVENQFVWFDAGELDELPDDVENAPPTAEQLAAEQEITARFGAGIEAAADERESRQLTERLYRRIARHPGMLRTLDSVGRAVTSY
jgi:Zn-finger nucleic acid-binding protein